MALQHSHTMLILQPQKQGASDQLLTPPDLLLGPFSLPNQDGDQHPLLGHAQRALPEQGSQCETGFLNFSSRNI